MENVSPKELLNQAEIVTKVVKALRDWWKQLEGKTSIEKITEADRQATREVLEIVRENEMLLRGLLNKYGCHEYIRPKLTSLLDLAAKLHHRGEDTGGWWSRAMDYAGPHLYGGEQSVPDELALWAAKLKREAAAETADPAVVPYDPDAFMSIKNALEDWRRPKDYNSFRKARKMNSWIKFDPQAPRQRPRVHRADWATFVKGPMNPDTFELIDVEKDYPSVTGKPSEESIDEYLADANAERKKIDNEKRRTGK